MDFLLLSQRDIRWKNIKLGFSNLTIGSSGCLITDLAMIADTTPNIVNQRLKAVNGFSGALVVWNKIQSAFPQLKFIWRSKVYDNNAVLSQIKRNGFCLVECRTLFGKHWVVCIGNRQMIDPYDGKIKPTWRYWFCGFSAIDKI
jgi:hypothetical protein